jgi:hypothetical protein
LFGLIPVELDLSNDEAWIFTVRVTIRLGQTRRFQAHVRRGLVLPAARLFALLLPLQLITGQIIDRLRERWGSEETAEQADAMS